MSIFLILLLSLITSHMIIDFYFQPASWVIDKNSRHAHSSKLFFHAVMHAVVACIPILFVTTDWRSVACMLFVVGISHWLIDLFKTYTQNSLRYFVIDQVLHVLVLLGIALHVSQLEWSTDELAKAIITESNLLIALGYIIILKPTSIFIGTILKKYTPEETDENEGLISGGEIIGYLERTLILAFTITGQFSVIGFILAAKSIFRFGELNNTQNHKLTEYVLLGSLLSVTVTSIVGLIIGSLLK